MEAKKLDLAEWEYFGEGGSSTSYTYKLDGNIVLKLNHRDIPASVTVKEYLASKAFHEAGFPSPEIYELVTDGERFGYTSRRVKGKISYARILCQEPGRADELARIFAGLALEIHGTPADESKMSDARDSLSEKMGDLSYVPADVAEAVRGCLASIGREKVCLHGDLNPGNLINFEGRNHWIGVNEFTYGDPFLDIATMHIICHYLPARTVSRLYHADQRLMRKFFKSFKQEYFGESWNSREVRDRIRNASIVKFCAAAVSTPEYAALLIPLVRGRKLQFLLKRIF